MHISIGLVAKIRYCRFKLISVLSLLTTLLKTGWVWFISRYLSRVLKRRWMSSYPGKALKWLQKFFFKIFY